MLAPLSALYGRALLVRRRRIESHPSSRHRLYRPVISIGNLSVGGSGKTPFVRWLALWLISRGERPSILSRGYARTSRRDEPVVVSDGEHELAGLADAGDEPLMLARTVPGGVIVVDPDRHRAGRVAEEQLGCTVHLLDDGFQHLRLHRDVNLLLLDQADLEDHVLPAGRLREPLAAARSADALLWTGDTAPPDAANRLGVAHVHELRREPGPLRVHPRHTGDIPTGTAVVALAAIARPERFFLQLEGAGLHIRARLTYRDHHPYTTSDLQRIQRTLADANASFVVTTEKDVIRLTALGAVPFPLAWQPMDVRPRDVDQFLGWLLTRLPNAGRPNLGQPDVGQADVGQPDVGQPFRAARTGGSHTERATEDEPS